MKRIFTLLIAVFAVAAISTVASADCGADHGKGTKASASEKKMDIVETAVNAGSFKTLVTAVKAADLVETLKSEGPFTVFAPSDEAFAKLPEGTIESLLKDKKKLASVLTYHVVPGKVMAADVVKLDKATTVQGQDIAITKKDGAVMVDGAKVVMTDIEASNGVIHVIDAVILPSDELAEKR
jgi:uncharacterized surface protein with fasciclin (FAS1) repeats